MPETEKHKVSFGAVTLHVVPWRHRSGSTHFRFSYHDPKIGRRRSVTRAQLGAAKAEALSTAKKLAKGRIDLADLPESTMRNLRRMLEVDPTLSGVDAFLSWKQSQHPDVTLADTIHEFLEAKKANRGRSTRNVSSLTSDLGNLKAHFPPTTKLANINVAALDEWMQEHASKSPKRRRNLRASAVTLFRWARRREYLPDKLTPAEMLERPAVPRQIPPTYEPAQIIAMLDACPEEYLPWLVLSGFHGIRYEELQPPPKSDKSPLAFEDIKRERGLIIVRPETSKLNERRVIPLQPGALDWLPAGKGRITPVRPVHKVVKAQGGSVTGILGKLVGGWKPNALRNSFISYRAAQVGLAKTAMEAGNSEKEARRSYNDAKSEEEAKEWFAALQR